MYKAGYFKLNPLKDSLHFPINLLFLLLVKDTVNITEGKIEKFSKY